MSEFAYRDGVLHCEGVPLEALADAVGTPFYCYSASTIERRYRAFSEAASRVGGRVCFAVKANTNLAVMSLLAGLGAGADVVSEGEARKALAAGVVPERIVFSGMGKTESELAFALSAGIGQINVESARELDALSRLAERAKCRMRVAIRVNPDVDARTHAKIATGKAENKFGIDIGSAPRIFARAASLPGITNLGVAVHIGSQLLDLDPFEAAFARVAALVRELRRAGIAIGHLDLGGGIGVPYRGEEPADLDRYMEIVGRTLGDLDLPMTFEPGRYLVAEAGVLVSRVIDVKQGATKCFVVQDGAMNDLIRPTLYDAWHPIQPVREPAPNGARTIVDVVGPVCETGDYLALDRAMPTVQPGDLLAVGMAGAYGAVMSSTYNLRPLPAELLVRDRDWAVVRPRQSYDELLRGDVVPEWLPSRMT